MTATIDVTLNLTEADRWFAATMLSQIPWGGGEATVLAFGRIHEVLRLDEVDMSKSPGTLNRSADKFVLSVPDAELLLQILCGSGGKAVAGLFGPTLVKLVSRIRGVIAESVPEPA